MVVESRPTEEGRVAAPRRPAQRRALIAVLAATLVGAGFGGGVALGHHLSGTSPVPLLEANDAAQNGAAEGRAIALVVGRTRPSDGATFDQWYRTRMARLAPGVKIEYQAGRSGGGLGCGEWRVYAILVPGPASGTAAGLAQFNEHTALASVDEATGNMVGLTERTAAEHIMRMPTGCPVQPAGGTGTWLGEFDAGAAP